MFCRCIYTGGVRVSKGLTAFKAEKYQYTWAKLQIDKRKGLSILGYVSIGESFFLRFIAVDDSLTLYQELHTG